MPDLRLTFGAIPVPVPENRSLLGLAPLFRERILSLLMDMEVQAHDPFIFETLRSDERQKYLFRFGRDYDDGRGIVTNCEEGHSSWHYFGLAADIISKRAGWRAQDSFWTALGDGAKSRGLEWGGDWPTFSDKPHVQFRVPGSPTPSLEIIAKYKSEGMLAVWETLGAL